MVSSELAQVNHLFAISVHARVASFSYLSQAARRRAVVLCNEKSDRKVNTKLAEHLSLAWFWVVSSCLNEIQKM